MKTERRIQISRSKYIEESRATAILRLNRYEFRKGELVTIIYKKPEDFMSRFNNQIDGVTVMGNLEYGSNPGLGALIAVGIANGKGEKYYRLISGGGVVKVRGVLEYLADVALLTNAINLDVGEVYVCKSDGDGKWYYVYKPKDSDERVLEPITGGPYIFLDTGTGYRWFYSGDFNEGTQDCKREDDFLAGAKTQKILETLLTSNLKLNLESLSGDTINPGDEGNPLIFKASASDETSGENLTEKCKFYIIVDGQEREITLDSNGRFTIPGNFLGEDDTDKTITVVAKYGIIDDYYTEIKNTYTVFKGFEVYFFKVEKDELPPGNASSYELVNKLQRIEPVIRKKENISWDDIILNYQRTGVAFPSIFGNISHIYDDNGLDYIRTYTAYSITLNGEDYTVFIKDDPVQIDSFYQEYSFDRASQDENEEELNVNTLKELLNSWNSRNGAQGLLMLNNYGRIPERIFDNISIEQAFPVIRGFLEEAPTSGMVTGDVYYLTGQKKLFTATSPSNGVLSDLSTKTIYYYNGKLYIVNKSGGLGPISSESDNMTSRVINSIVDIF